MNLLCPNCQKPLTVPEQYAGQPMRCPLCAGTFTVPALPQSAAPPPPPAAAPPPPAPRPAPPPPADTYGLKDPVAPPPSAPPPPSPVMDFEDLKPTFTPSSSVTGAPPSPSGPPPAYTEDQPSFPSTPTPEGYQRKYTVWFSPTVLQYVAPAALFLIFVLTCFAWVGVYPGGVPAAWQNPWYATLGWYDVDNDVVANHSPFTKGTDPKGAQPGWNVLLIFYLLLLLPTLFVTFACLALSFVPRSKLPPAVYPILPWRWGIVAALNLILLLFLGLQLVIGFSLENNVISAAQSEIAAEKTALGREPKSDEKRNFEIQEGMARQAVSRTYALDFVVLFQLLAIAAAGLMFCINRRGGRPAPRIDLLW